MQCVLSRDTGRPTWQTVVGWTPLMAAHTWLRHFRGSLEFGVFDKNCVHNCPYRYLYIVLKRFSCVNIYRYTQKLIHVVE